MLEPVELGVDQGQPTPPSPDAKNWILQLLSVVTAVLALVSGTLAKGAWWFRGVIVVFAGIVIVWVGWTLWPQVTTAWEGRRARAKQTAAAAKLYPSFLDIVKRFQRYADYTNNRADTVTYVLWGLSQQHQLNLRLPLYTGGMHFPGRLYDHLRQQLKDTPPSLPEFRQLLDEFGNILELYHRVYVLWPYEELRRASDVQIPPYMKADLDVQREEYNAFLRESNAFAQRINEVLGESILPSYAEMLKPLT